MTLSAIQAEAEKELDDRLENGAFGASDGQGYGPNGESIKMWFRTAITQTAEAVYRDAAEVARKEAERNLEQEKTATGNLKVGYAVSYATAQAIAQAIESLAEKEDK